MPIQDLPILVSTYVLAFFRVAAMMLFAPLFGSSRVPKRVRVMLAMILAASITPGLPPAELSTDTWGITASIAGEMSFGIAMGMLVSFVFIAAQWAGEIIGQQMGFNLGEVFDPQFGGAGSIVGELYFMLTLVVFLTIGGHHALLLGLRSSFDSFPLGTLAMNAPLFDVLIGFFDGVTSFAIRLAAPMLVTMLVVDLALGLVGKMMPQLNVMAMGLSLRSAMGLIVVLLGLAMTSDAIQMELQTAMYAMRQAWVTG
jgi:flagellar biosynthetic protein FliR